MTDIEPLRPILTPEEKKAKEKKAWESLSLGQKRLVLSTFADLAGKEKKIVVGSKTEDKSKSPEHTTAINVTALIKSALNAQEPTKPLDPDSVFTLVTDCLEKNPCFLNPNSPAKPSEVFRDLVELEATPIVKALRMQRILFKLYFS